MSQCSFCNDLRFKKVFFCNLLDITKNTMKKQDYNKGNKIDYRVKFPDCVTGHTTV